MNIDLQLHGVDEARRELVLRARRLVDLEPVLDDVADDILDLEDDVWETEGRAIGVRWPKLSEKYARSKAKKYPGKGILEQTGRLRRSLSRRGAPYQRLDIGNTKLILATKLGIATIHHRGGTVTIRGRQVRIPRRQIVKVRRVDRARWVGMIDGYIDTGRSPGRLVNL